jgi:hypothetical protein
MTAEERNELRIFANENYKQAFMPTILILLDEIDRLQDEIHTVKVVSLNTVVRQARKIERLTTGKSYPTLLDRQSVDVDTSRLLEALRVAEKALGFFDYAIGQRRPGWEVIHDAMLSTPEQTVLDDTGSALQLIRQALAATENNEEAV